MVNLERKAAPSLKLKAIVIISFAFRILLISKLTIV